MLLAASACAGDPPAMTSMTFPVLPGGEVTPPANADVIDVRFVLDGDSIEAGVGGEVVEVRLLGINTAERDECWSEEARAALDALLATDTVWLQAAGGNDRFGRILGYLFTTEAFVNHAMVEGGHAIALDTDHPERGEFLAIEELAYSGGRGWWAAGACGPTAGNGVAIAGVEYDAPGPDDDNLNGEWVGLANDGPDTDIGGWTLRDESSSHRYHFPTGTVLPAGEALIVRTGCGTDRAGELFWCSDGSVWTNGGDTVLLLDANGNVVDRRRYEGR